MDFKLSPVTEISVFPRIKSAVLKIDDKLVVFSPSYLLGKHGAGSIQVGSKFLDIRTGVQLLEELKRIINPNDLKGDRVEYKNLKVGIEGICNLVEINDNNRSRVVQEDVRRNKINVIYGTARELEPTNIINVILLKFDAKYGEGIEKLFSEKYGGNVSFASFKGVYAVATFYPGKYAPPMDDHGFWSRHALIKEKK